MIDIGYFSGNGEIHYGSDDEGSSNWTDSMQGAAASTLTHAKAGANALKNAAGAALTHGANALPSTNTMTGAAASTLASTRAGADTIKNKTSNAMQGVAGAVAGAGGVVAGAVGSVAGAVGSVASAAGAGTTGWNADSDDSGSKPYEEPVLITEDEDDDTPTQYVSNDIGDIPTMTKRSSDWIKILYEHIQKESPYSTINKEIIGQKTVPASLDDIPPSGGNDREYLKHQFAATATILRKRKGGEAPNSLIDIATGGGKTLLTAITTKLFLKQNERNMAVLMLPDFPSNNTFLEELDALFEPKEKFAQRQPPVYPQGDGSMTYPFQMFAHQRFNSSEGKQVFHSACSKRLNTTALNTEPPTGPPRADYINDREERKKQEAFNEHVHAYHKSKPTMDEEDKGKGNLQVRENQVEWNKECRGVEWSRVWAHAFCYENVKEMDPDKDKSQEQSKFQDWQYQYITNTGSGSMFTDVLKALAAGQEVMVIIDEFHTIYEDDEYPMNGPGGHGGVEYRKRLQRFVEYLAIHPNVRLVILTATPAIQKNAMQIYTNTLKSRAHLKEKILQWFHGSTSLPYDFRTGDGGILAKMSGNKMHLLNKVNGRLTHRNLWNTGTTGINADKLASCVLPSIPSHFFSTDTVQANDFANKARDYEGVLIYQHGPNRIQRTKVPELQCNSDLQYAETIKGLKTFFGNGVTFIQIGNKVCHLPSNATWHEKNDRIGQHLSYRAIITKIESTLKGSNTEAKTNGVGASLLLDMCQKYLRDPEKPSAGSWFLRFLIKTVIAAFRLKYVRDVDQQQNEGSPCRTLIMIEETFTLPNETPAKPGKKGKTAFTLSLDDQKLYDVDDKLFKLIQSYESRAEIVLRIIKKVYEFFSDKFKQQIVEKVEIVKFDSLCPNISPSSGTLESTDYDVIIETVHAMGLGKESEQQPSQKPSATRSTNITYIPSGDARNKVKCILAQTPNSEPEHVAHIYVTSMAWKKSIDLKQFALQQIIASVDVCASAKQALGRIRRLNCMRGKWNKQDYSRLELYLDDANANNHPFKTTIQSQNALLSNCHKNVKPLMSVLFDATNTIAGIPMQDFEEYSPEYVKNNKPDFSIDIGHPNVLKTDS